MPKAVKQFHSDLSPVESSGRAVAPSVFCSSILPTLLWNDNKIYTMIFRNVPDIAGVWISG